MKTPEEMAIRYSDSREFADRRLDYKAKMLLEQGFLAGYQAAKDQLAHVSKVMPQWISVNDRLPEEGQMCVVQSNWHGVLLSERIEDRWLLKEDDGHYERPTYWVTHWVPLPAPPKEEK